MEKKNAYAHKHAHWAHHEIWNMEIYGGGEGKNNTGENGTIKKAFIVVFFFLFFVFRFESLMHGATFLSISLSLSLYGEWASGIHIK